MRITLVGPGRAGMSVALAARTASHEIVAVMARSADAALAASSKLGGVEALDVGDPVPACDLIVIATRDDAIGPVAAGIAERSRGAGAAVHLSGLAPMSVLEPLVAAGISTGAFHPLQTLPTPETGVARLAGAWIGITAIDEPLRATLHGLAVSIGGHPFDVGDDVKPLYHSAAAAAANFPLVALAMASDLFEGAGLPFEAARPLVEAVVANAFELGPRAALTGPVARGDVATVEAQLATVTVRSPDWAGAFRAFVAELAGLSGRREQFDHLVEAEPQPPS